MYLVIAIDLIHFAQLDIQFQAVLTDNGLHLLLPLFSTACTCPIALCQSHAGETTRSEAETKHLLRWCTSLNVIASGMA